MKTPGKQTSSSKAYRQAIEELRDSVSGFQAAQDSLKHAAQSLDKIVIAHESVSLSLSKTEGRLQELMPEEFQRQLSQDYREAATLLESVSNQTRMISEASESATRAFMELREISEQHSRALHSKMDSEAKLIVENFAHETKDATISLAADLKLALDELSSNAAELTAQLKTQQVQKDLDQFRHQLENATKHISIATGSLSASGEEFRLLLEDSRSSVRSILETLSRTETQIPRWGLYVLVAQPVIIVMLLISLIL